MEALWGIKITVLVLCGIVKVLKGIFLYGDYVLIGVFCMGMLEDTSISPLVVVGIAIAVVALYHAGMMWLDENRPEISRKTGSVFSMVTAYLGIYMLLSIFTSYKTGFLLGFIPCIYVKSNAFLSLIILLVPSVFLGAAVSRIKERKRLYGE